MTTAKIILLTIYELRDIEHKKKILDWRFQIDSKLTNPRHKNLDNPKTFKMWEEMLYFEPNKVDDDQK